jgi:hypothetical protein
VTQLVKCKCGGDINQIVAGMRGTLIEHKFWSLVDKSGECWNWTAAVDKNGYGQFSIEQKMRKTHRVSYVLTKGEIGDRMCVLHSCDNPRCVNPSHLRQGTQADNALDRVQRGRQCCGASVPGSKLTVEDVRSLRNDRAAGMSFRKLGKKYGINTTTAFYIAKGRSWKTA